MTMLTHVLYQDEDTSYVLLATDTKVSIVDYDNQERKPYSIEEVNKGRRVTEKVFISFTGTLDSDDFIYKEMKKRLSPSDDLATCLKVIQNVKEIYKEKTKGTHLEEIHKRNVGTWICFLSGYYDDGTVGMGYISGNDDLYVFSVGDDGYYLWTSSVDKDATVMLNKQLCSFGFEYSGSEEAIKQVYENVIKLHAVGSYIAGEYISPTCKLHLLTKENDSIRYEQNEFDTKSLHDQLPSKDKIRQTLSN